MKLTDEQKLVVYQVYVDLKEKKKLEVSVGGYAGTGKSTILKYINNFFPKFAVCAFTGKAANVLKRKGIEASTIHSIIYQPYVNSDGSVTFDLKTDEELGYDGFIVDESSMVSKEIYEDLKSFNIPIVFIGDHGQLEPVGVDFNLMKNPDYTLEEIHRNAGDIAKFAEKLRFGHKAQSFKSDQIDFFNSREVRLRHLLEADQVICAYNKTRVETNKKIRSELGYTGIINEGEKIICLKNNKRLNLFNGMQGTVVRLYEDDKRRKLMDFESNNEIHEGIWYDSRQFGKERPDFSDYIGKDCPNPFDYANCITAHKAQGDEWKSIFVIEQRCNKWDHKRWTYTVASRAKEKIMWELAK